MRSKSASSSEPEVEPPERVKVSFNLPVDELESMRTLAKRRGHTVTDTFRRAIALEQLVDDAAREGAKLLIQDPDGTIREIVLV